MPPQRARLAAWATPLLLLLAPGSASAGVPVGSFAFELLLDHAIWLDVDDGADEFCEGFAQGFGGTLQGCDLSMSVDAKGKITGAVEASAQNGNRSVSLTGPIKGSLKSDSKTGLTGLSFSTKLSGELSDGGMPTAVSASAAFGGQIDGDGVLTGAWSDAFCSKAAGCVSEMQTPSPETLAGGGWTLFLEIADLGRGKLGGSASAELSDGTQCMYAISGKYSSKNDAASLKLTPTNAACSRDLDLARERAPDDRPLGPAELPALRPAGRYLRLVDRPLARLCAGCDGWIPARSRRVAPSAACEAVSRDVASRHADPARAAHRDPFLCHPRQRGLCARAGRPRLARRQLRRHLDAARFRRQRRHAVRVALAGRDGNLVGGRDGPGGAAEDRQRPARREHADHVRCRAASADPRPRARRGSGARAQQRQAPASCSRSRTWSDPLKASVTHWQQSERAASFDAAFDVSLAGFRLEAPRSSSSASATRFTSAST